MTTITDTASNVIQAIFLRGHLRLLAVGMEPSRGVTKGSFLKKAGAITGKTYKKGQYMQAADDLKVFISNKGEKGADNG